MLQDRRKSERDIINRAATITSLVDTLARDCLITDMSDGGVRLFAAGIEVPEEFVLLMEDVDDTGRRCRVVWRLGSEVGAEFVDDAEGDRAR